MKELVKIVELKKNFPLYQGPFRVKVGEVKAAARDPEEAEKNALRCPDTEAAERMLALVQEVKESGDSLGGVVEVMATGVPAGLGEPVFAKLDAEVAAERDDVEEGLVEEGLAAGEGD